MWIKVAHRAEDDEEIRSFNTYRNYLLSLRQFLENEYGQKPRVFKKLAIACEQRPSFSKIQTNKDIDLERIRKLLYNSWHTEIVFSIPRIINGDLVKYANHWAPIQVYYSIFLSLRALFESMGAKCPSNHTSTLQQISTFIVQRNLFPRPWNGYCKGLSELKNQSYNNFPCEVKSISNLSTPRIEEFWDWYALWLKTTRDRQFTKKREAIIKSKTFKKVNGKPRKKLMLEHKRQVETGLYATTLFDGLYRLRIRSNYEDADAFILGTMFQEDADSFHDSLVVILQSTLYIIEKCIARYIGYQKFAKIIIDFIGNLDEQFSKETIGLRQNYF